ncbi:hypothetical protein M8J75_016457 [Diaphorina citri]|nr:hypothetical protein M8J75_016457 [Diaphorina citri]
MLNKHHLLLDLMKLLVEVTTQDDDLKSKQAALWINDISRGFSKLERCLHIKLDLMKRNIGTELSVKQQFELIVKVADSTYTKLKHAIVLKGKLPHPSEFKEVLEEAMQNPSQHTLCFMSRIPKPPLVQLVKIYVGQSNHDTARPNSASQVSRVFTVESLLKSKSLESESHNAPKKRRNELQGASRKGKNESQSVFLHRNGHHRGDEDVEMKDADHGSSEKTNIWTLADDLDWLHCPLGCIPGKTEDKLIDFDLLADEDTL